MFFMHTQHKWEILWNAKDFFIWNYPIVPTENTDLKDRAYV
jgi:hypothetical protein